MDNENIEFKVLFLGGCGIGAKTSLINRISLNSFNENTESTATTSFVTKSMKNYLGNIDN